jgi:hypothetical protein
MIPNLGVRSSVGDAVVAGLTRTASLKARQRFIGHDTKNLDPFRYQSVSEIEKVALTASLNRDRWEILHSFDKLNVCTSMRACCQPASHYRFQHF